MCERYRLTRRTLVEVGICYSVDDVSDLEAWLDPGTPAEELSSLLKSPPEDWLKWYPVDTKQVNSALVDQPGCVEPIDIDVQALLKLEGGLANARAADRH